MSKIRSLRKNRGWMWAALLALALGGSTLSGCGGGGDDEERQGVGEREEDD